MRFRDGDIVSCTGGWEPMLYLVCGKENTSNRYAMDTMTFDSGDGCDSLLTDIFQEDKKNEL